MIKNENFRLYLLSCLYRLGYFPKPINVSDIEILYMEFVNSDLSIDYYDKLHERVYHLVLCSIDYNSHCQDYRNSKIDTIIC